MSKRTTGGSKRLQFQEPETNTTPIATFPRTNRNIIPSRKREEMKVMDNLRKKVPACELERRPPDEGAAKKREQLLKEQRAMLSRRMGSEEELAMNNFTLEILCWSNEYRARHNSPPLSVSKELTDAAQKWANHLAATNEFYYRESSITGQNLFCCPCSALVNDLTGQEVASYWYSTNRRYNYFKDKSLLHTSVNTGHFTQMIWKKSKYIGVGKSASATGKIFVVAYYYPCGNKVNEFHLNVSPPTTNQS